MGQFQKSVWIEYLILAIINLQFIHQLIRKCAFTGNYLHLSRHFLYRINTIKSCGHICLPYNCANTYNHLKQFPSFFSIPRVPPYFLCTTLYVMSGKFYPATLSTWAKTSIQAELASPQKKCGKVWWHSYYRTKTSHCFCIFHCVSSLNKKKKKLNKQ